MAVFKSGHIWQDFPSEWGGGLGQFLGPAWAQAEQLSLELG